MRNAIAIARKELNIYFTTPIAYVMFTIVTIIGSFFFLRLVGQYQQVSMFYMRFNNPQLMNRMNFIDMIMMPLYVNLGVVLIFVAPFLTMRLIAEERRQKTFELLMTTPVTPGQIVMGKYLAAVVVMSATILVTFIYPLLLNWAGGGAGSVEWHTVFTAYAGLLLLGAAFMAIGLFISSLTESQVVAALITFVVLLLTWIIGWGASEAEGASRSVLTYLSSVQHEVDFAKGVIDSKDLIYFGSVIVMGLFLTHRAVEAQRWS